MGLLRAEFPVGLIPVKDQHNLLAAVAAVVLQLSGQPVAALVQAPLAALRLFPRADDVVAIDNQERLHARREASTRYIITPAATEAFRLSRCPAMGRETFWSQVSSVRRLMPSPSAPMTSATPPLKLTFS